MLRIKCAQTDQAYGELLVRFFAQDFPANIGDKKEVLEAVSTLLFGTGQTRYGSLPSPESQVAMRNVFRHYIELGKAIPILVPWGSKKSHDTSSIDVAEVGAMKTLERLQRCVKAHYAPGLDISMRIEDVGGYYLFADEGAVARVASERYVKDFGALIRILNLDFIRPIFESQLMNEPEYVAVAEVIRPLLERFINDTDLHGFDNYEKLDSWQALQREGWSGVIPAEQRDYYRGLYARLFPGITTQMATFKLAKYFAGSLARYKLKATGARSAWGSNFIQLNFAPPAPGSPQNIVERRVYYRTLPYNVAKTHIPAWRAKGYLKVDGNTVGAKITSFNDPIVKELETASVIFSNDIESVEVRADTLID